jgi:hypothetical protein
MLVPEALHVPAVENETVKPELEVAETTSGPGRVCPAMVAKVIVCGIFTILNVFVVSPELYVADDSTDAETEQVPKETALMVPNAVVVPEKVHDPAGIATTEMVTVPPDGAIAVIPIDPPMFKSGREEGVNVGSFERSVDVEVTVALEDGDDLKLSPTRFVATTLTV